MTQEHLDELLFQFQLDANLQEKLKAASYADAVVAIAQEAGFNITADDLEKAQSKLSDQELESVSGGEPDIDDLKLRALVELEATRRLADATDAPWG